MALKENGIVSSTAFSTVILSTRDQDLDSVAVGRWLGSVPLSNDIAKVRMRFGYVINKEGEFTPGLGWMGR